MNPSSKCYDLILVARVTDYITFHRLLLYLLIT
jgi:hypothetical protein